MVVVKSSSSLKQTINLGGNMRLSEVVEQKTRMYNTSDEVVDLMLRYYDLLVNTNYLREPSYLFYVVGLSYKEVSEVTGVKINTLRTLLYNDVKRLYKDLGGYDPYALLMHEEYNNVRINLVSIIINVLLEQEDIEERVYIDYYNKYVKTVEDTNTFELDDTEIDKMLGGNLSVEPLYIDDDRGYNIGVSDDDFHTSISKLLYLTKDAQQRIINSIQPKMLGYIDYLYTMDESSLTDRDKERRKIMLEELGIE